MPLGNLDLIAESFIEAATDPSKWEDALDVVTTVTESCGALLLPISGRMLQSVPHTDSVSSSFEAYVRGGWFDRDERHRGLDLMKRRGVVDDLDVHSIDVIKRHPYYQEFLAPHGLRWFAGISIQCGKDHWCLSIQRTITQGPFSEADKSQLAPLSTRLSGTAAIAGALGDATAAGALEAFEMSGRGAALINREGRFFKLNQIAEKLLREDLWLVKGRLAATDTTSIATLERAVGELINSRGAASRPPIAFSRKGRHPLLAYPTRLASMARNALADCQAMIIFVDTEEIRGPPASTLQTAFRLTEAEARLAAQLACGDSLETAADLLDIAKETSRSQLKSIFSKTGAHRQAELVAMLSTLLRADDGL
ncbi:helix-turn-helix transcriptional regulator [Bradyrhizobium sp. RD5-C2]|uniref:helix-turn-helix transcriptional regulator n=1 Tax=Bradyrhizobium sp. RD5-C2 TaxID=244562 RepID=UPI001CC63804|nr:helix-turn-helix transcriptional regulator [Bradyrhizobium sp. RD5-C2]GIQ75354.1 transcriptional regulator [Bradyrhizobium sp. RD5-C2]